MSVAIRAHANDFGAGLNGVDLTNLDDGELAEIRACVEGLLAGTGTEPARVDRVFLTGGSSFVPAVRRIFEERFGEAKLRSGGELTSVASGLALRAAEGS